MLFLVLVFGLILAGLDIFFVASWGAGFKISFLVVGAMVCLAHQRPRAALGLLLVGAVAADLVAPLGWFGARIIGYAFLYALARWLSDSFFPLNRRGAALLLTGLLSLLTKISAGFYYYLNDWWAGKDAAFVLSGRYWLDSLLSSLSTVIVMSVIMYGFARFDVLTRRFFLIRR